MISLILIFSSVIWLFKISKILKNSESISYSIDSGIVCYSCKKNIGYIVDEQNMTISEFGEKRQCVSCKRESNLNDIIGKRRIKIFDFIYSEKWNTIFIVLIISSIIFQILNILLSMSFLAIIGGVFLNFANYGNYLHIKDRTIPKKLNP